MGISLTPFFLQQSPLILPRSQQAQEGFIPDPLRLLFFKHTFVVIVGQEFKREAFPGWSQALGLCQVLAESFDCN